MGKIVYHGTFAHNAPHRVDQPAFHAGTYTAAEERLHEAEGLFGGGIATFHGYEIGEKAPMSRSKWSDPHSEHVNYDEAPPVPENKSDLVYPYENQFEDVGSTSYVIPRSFVKEGHVRYLGPQFQELRGSAGESIAKAATTMVGGKVNDRESE